VKVCWIGVSLSLGSTGVEGLYDKLEEKNKVGLGILFLVGYWHPKMLALDILINTETMWLLNMMNFEAQIKVDIFKVSPNGLTTMYSEAPIAFHGVFWSSYLCH
jgi:hypothetical protein